MGRRSAGERSTTEALFGYLISKGEQQLLRLEAVEEAPGVVRVLVGVRSLYAEPSEALAPRTHVFPSRDKAEQFVEDVVTSFEYLGCDVVAAR